MRLQNFLPCASCAPGLALRAALHSNMNVKCIPAKDFRRYAFISEGKSEEGRRSQQHQPPGGAGRQPRGLKLSAARGPSYGSSRDSTSPEPPDLFAPLETGVLFALPEGSMLPSIGLTPVACSGSMLSSWPAFWGNMR